MEPIFRYLLQEPHKAEKPFLAIFETKGNFPATLRLKETPAAREITGRAGWLGGRLSIPEKGIELKGIQLDLPVWYRTASTKIPVRTLKGRLTVESATVSLLPEQPLNLSLNIGPNRISLAAPTVIKIPGGDLNLGPMHVYHLFSPDLFVRTRLAVDNIRLGPFLSKFWMRPFKGSLTGVLGPVRYGNHAITSRGKLTAKVFGGRIIFIQNISL
jgi:hypothetical protein